jgi:hypothetical protein
VLQVVSSDVFRFQFPNRSLEQIRTAVTLITVLYLFEMIYREKMRFAMLCHHCLTIFASGFMIVLLDKTQDPSFILTGTLWLFQATTEQLTFVALFGYRLEWHPKILRPMLQFAAIQSLLVKMASVVACIVIWFKYQKDEQVLPSYNRAWDVIIWIAAIGLMATQFWGSWVVWKMGTTLEARYERKRAERLENTLAQGPITRNPTYALHEDTKNNLDTPSSEYMSYPHSQISRTPDARYASRSEGIHIPALLRDA